MGTCCSAHLQDMIRDYIPNSENGAVTVRLMRTPALELTPEKCKYCTAEGEFQVSYHPK